MVSENEFASGWIGLKNSSISIVNTKVNVVIARILHVHSLESACEAARRRRLESEIVNGCVADMCPSQVGLYDRMDGHGSYRWVGHSCSLVCGVEIGYESVNVNMTEPWLCRYGPDVGEIESVNGVGWVDQIVPPLRYFHPTALRACETQLYARILRQNIPERLFHDFVPLARY